MWTSVTRVGTRGLDPSGAVETLGPRPVTLVGGPPVAGRQLVFVEASSLCRRMFSG